MQIIASEKCKEKKRNKMAGHLTCDGSAIITKLIIRV